MWPSWRPSDAPNRIDDRGSQVAKPLEEIGFNQYHQAEIPTLVRR